MPARTLPCVRTGGPTPEQDRLRRPTHSQADRRRRLRFGASLATPEPRRRVSTAASRHCPGSTVRSETGHVSSTDLLAANPSPNCPDRDIAQGACRPEAPRILDRSRAPARPVRRRGRVHRRLRLIARLLVESTDQAVRVGVASLGGGQRDPSAPRTQSASAMTASTSISTNISGSINPLTSTIVAAGG